MLEAGMKAPEIVLNDKDGKEVRLSDIKGKKIIYFYPKDNTAGCSKQAAGFAALYGVFHEMGYELIGISKDSESSHQRFAEKYELPFILLSDPELTAIKAYDVWQEKKSGGKVSMGVVRTTYLLDENNFITKVWAKAKAASNPEEVMEYIKE